MNVTLTPDVEKLVAERLKAGGYASADQVVHEALLQSRLFAGLGGAAEVATMDSEAKADAFEEFLASELDEILTSKDPHYPTVAEVEAKIETRPHRMGVGNLFIAPRRYQNVKRLPKMPAEPTLADFFKLRFAPANHVLQSAALAMKNGMPEEVVLACLLHDTAQHLMKADHGYWAAQLYGPYVPEEVAFAIRYHQALRFFPDPDYGYEYPDLYRRLFGEDYTPSPHVQRDYKMVRDHKWYFEARMVTVNDFYSFDPKAEVTIEPFEDIIGRHFKQPKEGLGNDGSPVAHMWRTIINPDAPL
jgi:Arc/MetJ-type ribon-helix-helix transcriptional regulator